LVVYSSCVRLRFIMYSSSAITIIFIIAIIIIIVIISISISLVGTISAIATQAVSRQLAGISSW
jgi:hypothetical protein